MLLWNNALRLVKIHHLTSNRQWQSIISEYSNSFMRLAQDIELRQMTFHDATIGQRADQSNTNFPSPVPKCREPSRHRSRLFRKKPGLIQNSCHAPCAGADRTEREGNGVGKRERENELEVSEMCERKWERERVRKEERKNINRMAAASPSSFPPTTNSPPM